MSKEIHSNTKYGMHTLLRCRFHGLKTHFQLLDAPIQLSVQLFFCTLKKNSKLVVK